MPSPAYAQAAATPTAVPQAAPSPPVVVGFQDGFFIQSANGDYRLVLGMVAQTDGRFSVDDPLPIVNPFTIRKVRRTFTGRVARYFDVRFSPAFRVRSGKDKTPIGYELLEGDAFLLFPERALASSLVPNRDIGVQAQGDLLSGKLFYAAGIFNGIPDGTGSTSEVDTGNTKDFAGRVVAQPFRSPSTSARSSANGCT